CRRGRGQDGAQHARLRDRGGAVGRPHAAATLSPDAGRPRDGERRGRARGPWGRLMHPRLLRYYESELKFMRELGAEFAAEFEKVGAGRLGIERLACAEPYVERLLEGFSFLAARIQLKIDAQFPRFSQHRLEMVYPNYLAPTPSMAVVQVVPDAAGGTPPDGLAVPRGTVLRSRIVKGEQTACEYRTAHELRLLPIEL